jgi:hypothetical protein
VPCGKTKIWSKNWLSGETPAKDAYISTVFKLHRKYAESIGTEWRILSAWYGFLHPDQLIQDYDAKFCNSDLHSENWWRLEGLFQQARRLPRYEQVVLLGGNLYRQIMRRSLSGIYLPTEIVEPFAGQSLLRMVRSLKQAFQTHEPVTVSRIGASTIACSQNHRHGLVVSLEGNVSPIRPESLCEP